MAEFVTVARVGEIPANRGKSFRLGDRCVAVFFVDGQYYALDDFCPHMGNPLSTGDIHNGHVICDRHLWPFRLSDGVCPEIPRLQAETFEIRVEGDEIQVRAPAAASEE